MKLSLKEVSNAIGAKLVGNDVVIETISKDSRVIENNCMYVALKGDRFDGHDFIEGACQKGAVAVMSERENESYNVPALIVKDCKIAMGDIARYYRQSIKGLKVVGITGSVGKTTTKDMVASVVSQQFKMIKTQENYNNDIGVPITIYTINEDTEVAVVEMGMNHFDEMDYLSSVALPDIGVITNVGVSHIENLGSQEGILKAKCELFNHMQEKAPKILNGDDRYLKSVSDKYENIVYCGLEKGSDIYADNIVEKGLEGISATIHTKAFDFDVNVPIAGRHMLQNAVIATAVGVELGISPDKIKAGIENFKLSSNRMDKFNSRGYTIINDVYNANPQSVKAGLDVLANCEGASCCVLGDMFELGENAPAYHAEVGRYAAQKAIDTIVCIGELSKHMYNEAVKSANAIYFENKEEFISKIDEVLPKGATILVKASRGMHFEKIIDKLRSEE